MPHFFRRLLMVMLLATMAGAPAANAEAPALAVVISIDQFRGDYLPRFERFFGRNGFNRLRQQGADFSNCHFEHALTKTGPGHAVMLTGVHANLHGIVANDWVDRTTFARTSCVGDSTVTMLGVPANAPRLPGLENLFSGRSPRRLTVETVGDELKQASGGRAKVIGISNKDRAAILMSGRKADAAYFMEEGVMVTSTYYLRALPAWVQAWNAAKKADVYFRRVWERALPAEAYSIQGPDDAPGEDAAAGQLGNTLPKTVTGGDAAPGSRFYDAVENTPFSNELLLDFVKAAVEHENLGGRAGVTDLLCVSFSANDHIGHLYGPDSHEIMDNVVRMDGILADLLDFLDHRIGLGRCTIVLTADHGVAPLPEHVWAINPATPAGRIQTGALLDPCEAALNRAFGPLKEHGRWLVRDDFSLLIHPSALAEKNVSPATAQEVVREALRKVDCVAEAYTRTQLLRGDAPGEFGPGVLLSFNRERSGDVCFIPKPFFISRGTGANHGAPYDFDTHVPLLWFGVGVKPGTYGQKVSVADLAPTLAKILGVAPPPLARGRNLF